MTTIVTDTTTTVVRQKVTPQWRRGQNWVLPHKMLTIVLAVAAILLLVGIILMAVGGLLFWFGVVLFILGLGGFLLLFLLCLHAHLIVYARDDSTQTQWAWEDGSGGMGRTEIPTYAVVNKSALKTSDSSLKRNGRTIEKHVTLAPDTNTKDGSGHISVAPSNGQSQGEIVAQIPVQQSFSHSQQSAIYKPTGPSYSPNTPINHPLGPAYVPPAVHQYPMQVYPPRSATSSSSTTSTTIRYGIDDDYDNPAETTPMLTITQSQPMSQPQVHSVSRVQVQSQPQSFSHTQSQVHSEVQSQSHPQSQSHVQYVAPQQQSYSSFQSQQQPPQQQQQQQQYQYQYSYQTQQSEQQIRAKSGSRGGFDDDLPEPQPLVYPSAKRPMTFEQTSSSKMSVYDNMDNLAASQS